MDILYLCDGHIEKCRNSNNCFYNGGQCEHTFDINHAKNFIKRERDDEEDYYVEKIKM